MEQLLTRVIRIYGFEHPTTISFARLLERGDVSEETLEALVESYEAMEKWGA